MKRYELILLKQRYRITIISYLHSVDPSANNGLRVALSKGKHNLCRFRVSNLKIYYSTQLEGFTKQAQNTFSVASCAYSNLKVFQVNNAFGLYWESTNLTLAWKKMQQIFYSVWLKSTFIYKYIIEINSNNSKTRSNKQQKNIFLPTSDTCSTQQLMVLGQQKLQFRECANYRVSQLASQIF